MQSIGVMPMPPAIRTDDVALSFSGKMVARQTELQHAADADLRRAGSASRRGPFASRLTPSR